MITPKELTEYLKVCRKHGVASLRLEGLELSLPPDFNPSRKPSNEPPTDPETQEPTEEEIMFYSSGGVAVHQE